MNLLSYWNSVMNEWEDGKYTENIYALLGLYRRFFPSQGALFMSYMTLSIPQRLK